MRQWLRDYLSTTMYYYLADVDFSMGQLQIHLTLTKNQTYKAELKKVEGNTFINQNKNESYLQIKRCIVFKEFISKCLLSFRSTVNQLITLKQIT